MAIADTINSIRTHLETDYEALENIGAELENVDKNIENIASVVNGIYDNLPKTTGEGTSLSLTTLKGKMNTTLKGDTEQDGTPTPSTPIDIEVVTGTQNVKVENVNLLNYNTFVKGRINSTTGQIEYASNTTNITATENTISFTTTQAWNSGIASEFMPIDQGSYTYSIKSATLKVSVYIDLYDKDQNFISRLGNKVINANEQTTWQVTISNTSAKYIRLHYEMGYADTITLTETQLEKRKHKHTIYTTPRTNTNSKFRRYRTM